MTDNASPGEFGTAGCGCKVEQPEFNLEQELLRTVKPLALVARQKGLELRLEMGADLPGRLVGDSTSLCQVLSCLVQNSINFTTHGGVRVAVNYSGERQSGQGNLEFSVGDTGIGIPVYRQLDDLEPLVQGEIAIMQKYGEEDSLEVGICRRLVSLMGGRIEPESEPAGGINFRVVLPIEAGQRMRHFCGMDSTKLRGRSILVVEDDVSLKDQLADWLRFWGMRFDLVSGAQEAFKTLELAEREGRLYDIVLLDAQMANGGGWALAGQIHSRPDLAEAVVMLLAPGELHERIDEIKGCGIASALTKPALPSELFGAIMDGLGIAKQAQLNVRTSSGAVREGCRKLNLLVTEDNQLSQKLAQAVLEKKGHRVTLASNGKIALELWQSQPYDAILMDVDMPEMNGYEAAAEIRNREKGGGRRIPIIAMTAHVMQGTREACIAAGMDGYLAKPIDIEALWKEMEKVSTALNAASGALIDSPKATGTMKEHARAFVSMEENPQVFAELGQQFLKEYPEHLADLHKALVAGNGDMVRRNAHALKGMCTVFAGQNAVNAARQVELTAGELSCAEAVYALEQELGSLAKVIGEKLAEPKL